MSSRRDFAIPLLFLGAGELCCSSSAEAELCGRLSLLCSALGEDGSSDP